MDHITQERAREALDRINGRAIGMEYEETTAEDNKTLRSFIDQSGEAVPIWLPITEQQQDGEWYVLAGQYRYPGDRSNTIYISTCKWDAEKGKWFVLQEDGYMGEIVFQHYLNEASIPEVGLEQWYTPKAIPNP